LDIEKREIKMYIPRNFKIIRGIFLIIFLVIWGCSDGTNPPPQNSSEVMQDAGSMSVRDAKSENLQDSSIEEDMCERVKCGENMKCVIKEGAAPTCICQEGFILNDSKDKCISEQLLCDNLNCPPNSYCIIKDGEATCECESGYHLNSDGSICIPDSPESSILCSWCYKNENCGEDNRCVKNYLGEHFCAIPCESKEDCPIGYRCEKVQAQDGNILMCVPDNKRVRCKTDYKPIPSLITYSFGTCPPPPPPEGTVGESLHIVVIGDGDREWFLDLARRLAQSSYRVWLGSVHQHYLRWVWIEDNIPLFSGDRYRHCKSFPCIHLISMNGKYMPDGMGARTRRAQDTFFEVIIELGGKFPPILLAHEWFHAYYNYIQRETCTYAFDKCSYYYNCHPLPRGCYDYMKRAYPMFDFTNPRSKYNRENMPPDICIQVTDSVKR
jgi:hypothetical protein